MTEKESEQLFKDVAELQHKAEIYLKECESKLKPCTCGERAEIIKVSGRYSMWYYAKCQKCKSKTPPYTRPDYVVEEWNGKELGGKSE